MCKTYGYCRISRKEQNIDRQERNIKALYPDAIIIKEAYTGTKVEGRKEFEKLIAKADSSTRIVFDSVSRMSRNAEEGFQLYKELFARGVELVFLKEPQIDTETYKSSMERQVSTAIDSGDLATNELITAITEAINRYTMRLAERQIFLAFQQAEKEVEEVIKFDYEFSLGSFAYEYDLHAPVISGGFKFKGALHLAGNAPY